MSTDEATTPEEVPEPISLPDHGFVYISNSEGLRRCVAELRGCNVLGVDTESDSFFSYREKCCLIQITGDGTIEALGC